MSDGWTRRQERTRRDVLDAAGSIIADHGVEAMTMRKLAERAGVAVATLYNQFDDRMGVLVAFVGAGLDQLEIDLDARPTLPPIDTTRALFDAMDARFDDEPDVWRPIFATIQANPDVPGTGDVVERFVQIVLDDFSTAAEASMFVAGVDVERLARHVFVTRMNRVQTWARGIIDWDEYRASSTLGLELSLAAVLTEPARSEAFDRSGIAVGVPSAH